MSISWFFYPSCLKIVKGTQGPLKNILSSNTYFKAWRSGFYVMFSSGFIFNDLPAIFSFFFLKGKIPSCSRSYCTKTSNFKFTITEQAIFLLGYISVNAERCLRSYSAFCSPQFLPQFPQFFAFILSSSAGSFLLLFFSLFFSILFFSCFLS